MDVAVVSLFPEMLAPVAQFGVVGRAIRRNLARVIPVDPRDFATDVHGTVDDRPYGGGPGMVIRVEPFATAIAAARGQVPDGSPVVFLSPQGKPFDQATARRYASLPGLVLVAGRYEGFDERLIEIAGGEEISVGDFVMSGGEIAAMAVLDATLRLLPGVLGDEQSAEQESFADGLLDHPHYTRPEIAHGQARAAGADRGESRGDPALAAQAGPGPDEPPAPRPAGQPGTERRGSPAAG